MTREDNLKGIRPKSQTLSELMTFIRQALGVKSFMYKLYNNNNNITNKLTILKTATLHT